MSALIEEPLTATLPASHQQDAEGWPEGDWALDVSIVESGPAADQLIVLTDNGCNSTCATACTSCK